MSIQESLDKLSQHSFLSASAPSVIKLDQITSRFFVFFTPTCPPHRFSVTLLDCVPSLLYVWNCHFDMLINIAVLFQVSAHIFQALQANVLWCQQVITKKGSVLQQFLIQFRLTQSQWHWGRCCTILYVIAHSLIWKFPARHPQTLWGWPLHSQHHHAQVASCFFVQQRAQWVPLDHHGWFQLLYFVVMWIQMQLSWKTVLL